LEKEPEKITVRDVMTKSVLSIDSSVSIKEAAKMMEDTRVGAFVIMEENTPIGIITDRDFAIKVAAHEVSLDSPVKEIMSAPLFAITPKESVWMAADLMYTRGIRKLPVIDDDKVVGIITATDLITQFAICTEEDVRKMYYNSVSKIFKQYNPYK